MSFAERKFTDTSDGTRRLIEDINPTIEISKVLTAKEELGCVSTKDSNGCAPLQMDPAPSCSEYVSRRIQSLMDSSSEFGSSVKADIESSKNHWSELQAENGEAYSAEKNMEMFRILQQQYGPGGFFRAWDNKVAEVGEKIAEGGQAEIFEVRFLRPEHAHMNDQFVLKVFKQGSCLQDLQKQWPRGMLLKATASKNGSYHCESYKAGIASAVMLEDGRFAFGMARYWGDLRKLIDLRMFHNGNQAPPFTSVKALEIMFRIARGMRRLHEDNIVHRDLKASNVLIYPKMWIKNGALNPHDGFYPTVNDNFISHIADFECSDGVVGTRFWRAPEILLGVKTCNIQPSLFTEKSDVYSYAMTCYEVLTGKVPLENLRVKDYDIVLQGARPILPHDTKPCIKSLLCTCWHRNPSKRPSFKQIVDLFKYKIRK